MSEKKSPNQKSRVILPKSNIHSVTHIPKADAVLADALSIIESEIRGYKMQSSTRKLDVKEARIVQQYIKALTELSKENRERQREEDLSNLTDEQLLELAKSAFANHSSTGTGTPDEDE